MVLASEKECNKNRGIGDKDRDYFGMILSAAALLSAGYSAYKAYDIAKQEWNMAKKYWRIAQNWMDYYKNYYAPVEDQEIAEALALEEAEPFYEIARGRARANAWFQFRGQLRQTLNCTSRYCTGLRNDMLVRLTRAQADAVSMSDGLGYRNERAYVEARNDVRFERRLNTAKRGRDIISGTAALGKAAANIYGDLGDQYWQGLVGAGKYLGYTEARNQTGYPGLYSITEYNRRRTVAAADEFDPVKNPSQARFREAEIQVGADYNSA